MNRASCWGEGCRVTFYDGVELLQVAAQGGASATWQAMCHSEGQFIYNLFRRQLAVFIPTFDPMTQIEADVFMQRSFYLKDLIMSPAALSVLIPLSPPGLNFTGFWVSDVRVSWVNLLSLDQNPIVLEIDSIKAKAAELPAGSPEEVEAMIEAWLDVIGGPEAVPFRGRYPLLDGATFHIRSVELQIDSPKHYGKLEIQLQGVDILAVDADGRQKDLSSLVQAGATEESWTTHRLVECSQVSARYVRENENATLDSETPPPAADVESGGIIDEVRSLDFEALQKRLPWGWGVWGGAGDEVAAPKVERTAAGFEMPVFALDPTPLAVLLSARSRAADLRHTLAQRWTVAFPGAARFLTLPPFLTPAPEFPSPDPRLAPFPPPSTEYSVRFADGFPFQWQFSRFQTHRPQMHPVFAMVFTVIAVSAVLAIFTTCNPRPWVRRATSCLGLLSAPFFR